MTPHSIRPRTDLREMLRAHIIARSLACMEAAQRRRVAALQSPQAMSAYSQVIRKAVQGFYGTLPAGPGATPPKVIPVSVFSYEGYRVENVLFETYPGWQVNASVYLPSEADWTPPYPVVIVPVGHSGKQFESYQLPCQYFARSGYIAICFDPPGQASEKQAGNDHFVDGVRDYLLGRTSSRYFISDAIRCIDYAATRPDADLSCGVAMTGCSGGGTTTTFAALLDERIAVTGPCCCLSPLAALDIRQCYNQCPEVLMFRRYAEGIDEADLICAWAPKPCLLMAGEDDEVFRIEDVRGLAGEIEEYYKRWGMPERFEFAVHSGGHAYPLEQACTFARFMNRWLLGRPERYLPNWSEKTFSMRPYEELRCYPRTDVNMRSRALAEADELASKRACSSEAIRSAVAKMAGLDAPAQVPDSETGAPFQVWFHDWRSVMLRAEEDIELPATYLTSRLCQPAATLLHLDDAGRHRLLHRGGPLARAIRFLEQGVQGLNLLTVDLRGWGDTAPAMYPYEMAPWGSIDRYTAYKTAALGDPIMAMRIRDALAALAWLRSRPEVDPARIVVTGSCVGAIVALHVAVIDGKLAGLAAMNSLTSFRSLIAAERYPWPADTFLPNALKYYDLPDLANWLGCPAHFLGMRSGDGGLASETELASYRADHITLVPEASEAQLPEAVERVLRNGD